jgi:hypothetical protein
MNHEKWIKLSDESKNIKIAELDGWKKIPSPDHWRQLWEHPTDYEYEGKYKVARTAAQLPNYIDDLNAMQMAVDRLEYTKLVTWLHKLGVVIFGEKSNRNDWVWIDMVRATAAQRAEAFVLTMEPE